MSDFPHITRTKGVVGGQWHIDGTRLTTKTIADLVESERKNGNRRAIRFVASCYGIKSSLVMEACSFEWSMVGAAIRLRAAWSDLWESIVDAVRR